MFTVTVKAYSLSPSYPTRICSETNTISGDKELLPHITRLFSAKEVLYPWRGREHHSINSNNR